VRALVKPAEPLPHAPLYSGMEISGTPSYGRLIPYGFMLRRSSSIRNAGGRSNEVAEHCLAHALPTIQATYNRYAYLAEKRDAFERLANLVERIINPDNVVAMTSSRPSRRTSPRP
jgi:hypothetical protein